MNLPRALKHLATVGITPDVLREGNTDPDDPAAVRTEVETLLRSALAENCLITSMQGVAALQKALAALLTDQERRRDDALAEALRAALVDSGVLVPAAPAARFEACLGAG